MRILLGVSGGIAAYKAADLTSKLAGRGHSVRVVMTRNATRFVSPLTFQALSAHGVLIDELATSASPQDADSPIDHIAWAKWAEVAVIAPMTANTLSRLAVGFADDALSTVWMALPPIPNLLCPAMNTAMWEHPVVQRNLRWIAEMGRYTVIPPIEKRLACGDYGAGALPEVPDLVAAIEGAR
jgi:phosphopantothenoylcysteine synthetase/decarboxylase